MPVVFAPRDGNEEGADDRDHAKEQLGKVSCPRHTDNPQLAGKEEGRESKASKGEGRMARREGPPPVLEDMSVWAGAHGDVDRSVAGRVRIGLAAIQKVGTGAADGILDDVGEDVAEADGNEKGEVSSLVLSRRRAQYDRVDQNKNAQGDEEGVYKVPD